VRLFSLAFLLVAIAAPAAVPREKINAVRGFIRERKLPEAEAAARALIAQDPNDAESRALFGAVCVAEGDADQGVQAFEKAVELAPRSSEIRRQLGDAYGFAAQKAGMISKFGLARKCRAAYEKAIELDPRNLAARNSLMIYYQQAPGIVGGGIQKAYEQAAEIKKIDPTRGRIAYATLYVGESKYTEAFGEIEPLLQANPNDYAALYQLGRLSALSGDRLERGTDALRKCLELTPPTGSPGHDAVHWRLGNIAEKKGDKAEARTEYETALKITPTFPAAIESLKKLNK
jgi:cytochrome c-type biogenesis protein CcmH/NrfG